MEYNAFPADDSVLFYLRFRVSAYLFNQHLVFGVLVCVNIRIPSDFNLSLFACGGFMCFLLERMDICLYRGLDYEVHWLNI